LNFEIAHTKNPRFKSKISKFL